MDALSQTKIYKKVNEAIQTSMAGAFHITHNLIKYTYNRNYILKKLDIDSFDDLFNANCNEISRLINRKLEHNTVLGFFEGVISGIGGLGMTLSEIPIFFGTLVRVQQEICSAYGYDPESEFEQAYMLKAMSFSMVGTAKQKYDLLLELNALKVAIKRHTYKELKEMGGKYLIPEIAKKFASKHGKSLSKKKMTQAIPVIGGAFGGAFNVGFVKRVIKVTHNLYKTRFLEDKVEFEKERMIVIKTDVVD